MNPNFINTLEIENFKSILNSGKIECNRINVFVGRPNVGKSNILEGISLLKKYKNDYSLFAGIRHERVNDLFYKKETKNQIKLTGDDLNVWFSNSNLGYRLTISNISHIKSIQDRLQTVDFINDPSQEYEDKYFQQITFKESNPSEWKEFTGMNVKKKNILYYLFKKDVTFKDMTETSLIPPFGNNLLNVIETNSSLRKEITSIVKDYELKLYIDREDQKIGLMKFEDGVAIKYPYTLIADTLQRYIFHFAAIESNENSIILFEEPEAHSYSGYVQQIAEKIIESETNQFFLTTHSPDILLPLLENDLKNEVSVFNVTYANEQTIISKLSDSKLREMMDNGISILANLENLDVTI